MSCSCHSARLLLKLIILVSTIIAFVLLEIYQIIDVRFASFLGYKNVQNLSIYPAV